MRIYKNMINLELAELLRAVAASYQLKGEEKNRFRMIAYQRAADAIEHLSSEAKDLWDDGKLEEVAGVGKNIAEHLDEIFKTGKSKHFEKIMKGFPPAMFELMKISGIGAKTAFKLSKQLGIIKKAGAIKKLEKAIKEGKVSGIEGFGEQSQVAIEKSIKEVKGKTRRLLLPYATSIADEVIEWIKKEKSVKKADPLGSLRRKASTVGDIDIAVATTDPQKTLDHFTNFPKKQRVLEKGDKTASIMVPGSVQVDLMVQPPDSYGALLQHFTGSKHHNIALREYAIKKQMSLSEYGIKQKGKLMKYSTEEDFYKKLGMDWIEPELREDMGEIEAAINHKLPKLVKLADLKGDLQMHSSFDIETSHDLGESSMKELVEKAGELGCEYIAITEHNPSQSKHNEKQIIDILKRKKEEVEKLNSSFVKSKGGSVKKVFNSLEIDILPDGRLPVPDEGLKLLDFALVAIHSSFGQTRQTATKRVLSALAHPKVKILAHPTCRMLGKREGIEFNWPEIFEFCQKHDKWLEINANPVRLDLPDVLVHEAIKAGVKLTLGTDAHHKDGLDDMRCGVSVARRGWTTKKDIINTR
ncbi:MAG: DNA polymerase/3'-5' exonuclease PolX, partial [Microgenomates group bacterium]